MSFCDVDNCDWCGEFVERNDERRTRGLSLMCSECSLKSVQCYYCHEWEHPSANGDRQCVYCGALPIAEERTEAEMKLASKMSDMYFARYRQSVRRKMQKECPEDWIAWNYGGLNCGVCKREYTLFLGDFDECPKCSFTDYMVNQYVEHLKTCAGDADTAMTTFPQVVGKLVDDYEDQELL